MDRRQYLIALNAADRITRAALCRLGTTLDAWSAARDRDAGRLGVSLGVPPKQLRKALALRRRAHELASREQEAAERSSCRITTLVDPEYPRALLDLTLPPPVLYRRGRFPAAPAIAIVGSRRMDDYGGEVAALFARRLAAAGLTVVSGFAIGVDGAAHRAALAAPGGRTVAVLGCGIDVDYPRRNAGLAARIAERGAVLSEFPLGVEPRPWHFPVRNRVIAALSYATLVVQAALRSGSLITAHQALELGRDVWAVPGRIFDERSLGANALIADGALVARTPDDILEGLSLGHQQELFPAPAESAPAPSTAAAVAAKLPRGLAGKVLAALPAGNERTAEAVAAEVDATVETVLGALLELELEGFVRRQPGPLYTR